MGQHKKKKRNKSHKQATKPSVMHVTAVKRSRVGQWWYDNKRFTKPAVITAGIAFLLSFVIFELVRLVAG